MSIPVQGGAETVARPGTAAVRVGLVDDHAILRASLAQLLHDTEDLRVVAQAASGREAIDLVRQQPMDVLIMDLAMPGQTGMDVIGLIRSKAPQLGILVFSAFPEDPYALGLLRRGAQGYLSKACDPAEIVAAVRTIAHGRRYISHPVAELLARQLEEPQQAPSHHALSDRELQVLLRLARGQNTRAVARALCLSAKTVSTHRTRIMAKLGLHSNGDVTYYALKSGLID